MQAGKTVVIVRLDLTPPVRPPCSRVHLVHLEASNQMQALLGVTYALKALFKMSPIKSLVVTAEPVVTRAQRER